MTPVFGFACIAFVLFGFFLLRPKHSLKARAQERYRRDRKATRQRDRMTQR